MDLFVLPSWWVIRQENPITPTSTTLLCCCQVCSISETCYICMFHNMLSLSQLKDNKHTNCRQSKKLMSNVVKTICNSTCDFDGFSQYSVNFGSCRQEKESCMGANGRLIWPTLVTVGEDGILAVFGTHHIPTCPSGWTIFKPVLHPNVRLY